MDFTKFVSMLEEQSLFFSRVDCLDDPFEGSLPKRNLTQRSVMSGIEPEHVHDFLERWSTLNKWHRQWAMVNCWHMSEHESAAMWKLYAKTNEAICIQSTYERLDRCLDEHINIVEVQYIDYSNQLISEGDPEFVFMCKRKSFEHERELRAIHFRFPITGDAIDFDAIPPDGGVLIKVDLDALIENVYVAPSTPTWFHELIKKVSLRHSLNKPVIQSALDEKPIF